MAIVKPSELPLFATNATAAEIDTPYATAGRIATGYAAADAPRPQTFNGLQYWNGKWIEYFAQDRVKGRAAGLNFVIVGGAPTVNVNTLSLTLGAGDDVQIEIPLEDVESVVGVRFRHQDAAGIPGGRLRVGPGYARDNAAVPIGASTDFAVSNVWTWDTYAFAPSPYVHAADTDVLEFVLTNIGDANVIIQKIETTYRLV
jgi:hypothetical protein